MKCGLSKIDELREELETFKNHKNDIEQNTNFEYELDRLKVIQVDLTPGQYVTNCVNCTLTCHENCAYSDDNDKMKCSAMTNGKCTVCKNKCAWNVHKNMPYTFVLTTEKGKGNLH